MNLSNLNEKEKRMKRILEIILFPDFEYEFVRECTPAGKFIHKIHGPGDQQKERG